MHSNNYQKTIKKSVIAKGIGLHTGLNSIIKFKPAKPDSGINFIRTDVDKCPLILASIDNVIDIARGTIISKDGFKIHTVEHILSAIAGLGIDNILIELSSKEPPVLDGSSKPYVDLLQKAGIESQSTLKKELIVDKTISYIDKNNGIEIHLLPSDSFKVTFISDYNADSIGTQHFTFNYSEEKYINEISSARTFCLFSEIMPLKEAGLIKGGSIENAVVFVDKKIKKNEVKKICDAFKINADISIGNSGILNDVKLRFSDEPVRHKILDLIGDLTLLGIPIKGHIIATKSGHAANVEFVKKIKSIFMKNDNQNNIVYDIHDILKIMPHRYPFLLIDKIIGLKSGEIVKAVKNVTISEPFYNGHFPNDPIMPGVLILEAMAQAGGFLLLNSIKNPQKKLVYFTAVKNARFKKAVIPGDQLILEVKLLKFKLGTCKIAGKAYVNDELVANSELMATVVDRKQ